MLGEPRQASGRVLPGKLQLDVVINDLKSLCATEIPRVSRKQIGNRRLVEHFRWPIHRPPGVLYLEPVFRTPGPLASPTRGRRPVDPMGSLTRTAVPASRWLSIWILPPMASTRSTRPVSPEPLEASAPPFPSSRTVSSNQPSW